jgi:hypothetical protein
MKAMTMNKEVQSKKTNGAAAQGPSYFEVAYLGELKKELEIFLRSKNFSTIQAFDIAFAGQDYTGSMRVSA